MDLILYKRVLVFLSFIYRCLLQMLENQNMNTMPHELVWGEVYFPPFLLVIALAYALTMVTGSLATKFGLHKFVAFPAIAEICLVVLFTGVIGLFIPIL